MHDLKHLVTTAPKELPRYVNLQFQQGSGAWKWCFLLVPGHF